MNSNHLPTMRFNHLIVVFAIFFLMFCALVVQQERDLSHMQKDILSSDIDLMDPKGSYVKTDCLALYRSTDERSAEAKTHMEGVFTEMKLVVDYIDLEYTQPTDFSKYSRIVVAVSDLASFGSGFADLLSWTQNGGQLMMYIPPDPNGFFKTFASRFGIIDAADEMGTPLGLMFIDGFMVGSEGQSYAYDDPFPSSLSLSLKDECTVHVVSADTNRIPLLWEKDLGKGHVVFCNIGITEKSLRGIYAQAFSLLGSSFAWPVINASTFYLDDFPSPVPDGSSEYIIDDYGISVKDFYTNVWWPDLKSLSKKYGIKYSGMIIETYSDTTSSPFESTKDTVRFEYFRDEILSTGGELGYHGYNHVPLVTKGDLDESKATLKDLFSYDYWPSLEEEAAALQELSSFSLSTVKTRGMCVYVPPSNILSNAGKSVLLSSSLGIRVIASIYLQSEDDLEYIQEFSITDDGVINTPRVISGGVLDDYMKATALSELNMHCVNSHFMHPDDVLDADRGAELGWETLFDNITNYTNWLYSSIPTIRNATATEIAQAVQVWYATTVTTDENAKEITLHVKGTDATAYCYLRSSSVLDVNNVSGGSIVNVADGLYLVSATGPDVVIGKAMQS